MRAIVLLLVTSQFSPTFLVIFFNNFSWFILYDIKCFSSNFGKASIEFWFIPTIKLYVWRSASMLRLGTKYSGRDKQNLLYLFEIKIDFLSVSDALLLMEPFLHGYWFLKPYWLMYLLAKLSNCKIQDIHIYCFIWSCWYKGWRGGLVGLWVMVYDASEIHIN